MKAMGPLIEGSSAYEAGRFTRAAMKTNSSNARRDGAAEASRLRDTARLAMGRQLAGLASSGFNASSGSALDALRESAVESELEIMSAQRRAEARAQGYKVQGDAAYASGYNAMTAGIFNGAAALVESAAGAYGGGG